MSVIVGLLKNPQMVALFAPMLVGILKKVTTKIPSWAQPVLCIVAGAVLSALGGGDLTHGLMAGAAGVGVREMLDQGKKAVS